MVALWKTIAFDMFISYKMTSFLYNSPFFLMLFLNDFIFDFIQGADSDLKHDFRLFLWQNEWRLKNLLWGQITFDM